MTLNATTAKTAKTNGSKNSFVRFATFAFNVFSYKVFSRAPRSARREVDRDGHPHGDWLAVHHRRLEVPVAHRLERGIVEQRDRAHDLRVGDVARFVDDHLGLHDAVHT